MNSGPCQCSFPHVTGVQRPNILHCPAAHKEHCWPVQVLTHVQDAATYCEVQIANEDTSGWLIQHSPAAAAAWVTSSCFGTSCSRLRSPVHTDVVALNLLADITAANLVMNNCLPLAGTHQGAACNRLMLRRCARSHGGSCASASDAGPN
jgi:hypothetical protein